MVYTVLCNGLVGDLLYAKVGMRLGVICIGIVDFVNKQILVTITSVISV